MEGQEIEFVCTCGKVIPEADIDCSYGESEGDPYTKVSAYCKSCESEYETSTWGEIDRQDAKELLIESYHPANQ